MKYFTAAALMGVIQGVDIELIQTPKLAQIKKQPVSQVKAHLNKNYFAQLMEEKKHVCDYTATRNKDPNQQTFASV